MTKAQTLDAFPVRANWGPAPINKAGVYAFWRGSRCFYIGQSRHLGLRIAEHHLRRRRGYRVSWLTCSKRFRVERWLIYALQPRYNKQLRELYGQRIDR